jgi:uncharacterized lipoprotein YehR (DUF1307 family)
MRNMKRLSTLVVALATMVSLASCQKQRWYVYAYHWTDGPRADWHTYNIVADEYLSDGAIEVYRQTEDNKVIQRGETANGVVWESYITFLGSQDK